MNIRPYTAFDYPLLVELSQARNFPVIPQEMLPGTGFIVENHCMGFLYKTDSKIAWLEWVISNPSSNKEIRAQAMDKLINALIEKAKELGFRAVFSAVSHPGLLERYKSQHGFQITDKDMVHLVRGI